MSKGSYMKYLKKHFGKQSNLNDANLTEDNIGDPYFDGDLMVVAILLWIVAIVILFLLFVYMIYDLLFVGSFVIRVLFGIIILVTLGLYIRHYLSKLRSNNS
jgi:hypothetical protein